MPRPLVNEEPMTGAERQARIAPRMGLAHRWFAPAAPPTGARGSSGGTTPSPRLWSYRPAGWLDALPDNQHDSALAEALRTIVELDLSELQAVEPPRGFGRD